jgi:hypothetical protein
MLDMLFLRSALHEWILIRRGRQSWRNVYMFGAKPSGGMP